MLNHAGIAALIPHAGTMCLLDSAEAWTQDGIVCRAGSHLAPGNPLRRDGRLSALCGCEYGFQAAALHGALLAGGVPQPIGYVAAMRVSAMTRPYLDDPEIGTLRVEAARLASQPGRAGLRISPGVRSRRGSAGRARHDCIAWAGPLMPASSHPTRIVMVGLVPATHAGQRVRIVTACTVGWLACPRTWLPDCVGGRDKPGHDGLIDGYGRVGP